MKNSTSITGLIAPVITREVIMENEIADLNVLFLNLNNIFQVLFTIYIPTIIMSCLFPKCTVPSVHVVQ